MGQAEVYSTLGGTDSQVSGPEIGDVAEHGPVHIGISGLGFRVMCFRAFYRV